MLNEFELLEIKLENPPDKLDLKLTKKKGEIPNNFLIDKKLDEESYELYKEAKNLPVDTKLPNPYWNIYYLISPISMFDESSGITYNKISQENRSWMIDTFKKLSNRQITPVAAYSSITGILKYYSHNFFTRFSNVNKPEKALFIFSALHMSSVEEYIVYREKKSTKSYQDSYYCLDLPFYVSRSKSPTFQESKNKFLKVHNKVKYTTIESNICNRDNLTLVLEEKLDLISINVSYYLWLHKKYYSYINSQVMFNLIIFSIQNLNKGGVLKFNIGELDSQLLFDCIALVSYYFEDVYIHRPPNYNILSPYKDIICHKFKGISEEEINKLKDISDQWNAISEKCTMDFLFWDDEEYFAKSFLDYKGQYSSIKDFNNMEIVKKMVYFKRIIDIYNDIRLNGNEIIEEELNKKISNSLNYLKINKIEVNLAYKNLNNDILKKDLYIDFKEYYSKRRLYNNSNTLKFIENSQDYDMPRLNLLENNLKFSKRILDTFGMEKWKEITFRTKRLEPLKKIISQKIGFEISQAFLKLYEILDLYHLVPKEGVFNTFHFCELPGQFIKSTKYFVESRTRISRHNWKAQSLKPSSNNKTIFGDTYNLIKDYPDRWDFGEDDTGDITKNKNIKHYKRILSSSDLVTSDCGLEFRGTDAVYQDKEMALINFCQILMVLNGLKKGSHYVSKVFLPQTINYIVGLNYLLSYSFSEFYIHKSAINRGSSEVYIVCKNFKGVNQQIIEKLFNFKNRISIEKRFIDIPQNFLDNYSNVFSRYLLYNIKQIRTNIYYYQNELALEGLKKEKGYIKENMTNWVKFFHFTIKSQK